LGLSPQSPKRVSPLFPHYLFDILIICFLILGVLLTLAVILPRKIFAEFNPFETPVGISAPFFLLPFYYLNLVLPSRVAGIVPLIFALFLLLLPWIDRSKPIPMHRKPLSFILTLVMIIGLTIIGILGFLKR